MVSRRAEAKAQAVAMGEYGEAGQENARVKLYNLKVPLKRGKRHSSLDAAHRMRSIPKHIIGRGRRCL